MSYKVGDKVRLRNGMDVDREFYFAPSMYFDGEAEITEIEEINGELCYKIPGKKFLYKESMLELVPHEFKVGDMVELRAGLEDGKEYEGWLFCNQMIFCGMTKIERIEYFNGKRCYALDGVSGYKFSESMLEPAEEKATEGMPEPANKSPTRIISIVVKGNTITATEYGRKGVAWCHPEDNFNLAEGVKLAIERLENPWPRNGDQAYAVCGGLGNNYVSYVFYDDSAICDKNRKKNKLYFRTEKQAQAFIERLEDFIKRDRGLE